jgi:hypothetical protein
MALIAGVLIVVAQLLMLPFDLDDHVGTSTDPQYQIAGGIYMAGFAALLVALVGAFGWGVHRAGKFGTIAFVTALVGTFMLGGDLWFETFAVPWLADAAPSSLDTDPTTVLAIGAVASYLSFAIGWALFGIAAFRTHAFPKVISAAIVVGGVVGFSALVPPLGIPIGLAVTAMGAWMIRSRASADVRAPALRAQYADQSVVA